MRFGIVTPTYNSEDWICQNIQTVKHQSNKDFIHLIINDASTDSTDKIIEKNKYDNLILINNKDRKGPVINHWEALQYFKDKVEIIVHLDGDDWFLYSDVLSIIDNIYKKNDSLLMTYGEYLATDLNFPNICTDPKSLVVRENIKLGWPFTHLRTFKANLIKYLKEEDFKDENGEWLSAAADTVIFCPILDMVGYDRVGRVKIPLIQYNRFTSKSEDKIRMADQIRCAICVYNKKPYPLLN